jgi:hypothetical protein
VNSAESLILPPTNLQPFSRGIASRSAAPAFAVSFDTSGIDRLERENEADRIALIAGLKTLGLVFVTGMNVSESLSIPGVHRARRLGLLGELTGEIQPLQPPNTLLGDIARAYQERRRTVNLGDAGCWNAVKDPNAVNDSMAAESYRWHQDREEWFVGTYRELREAYAPVFKQYRNQRPRSAAFMIRFFIERGPQYWDLLLIPIYERQTGHRPTHAEFDRFLKRVPAWKMFWLARIYALFRRSVRLNRYGKNNAGLNDLDSAIYLPFCDWFVTADIRQRRALRVVNAANPKRTEILSYDLMRSRLVGIAPLASRP